MMKAHHCFGKRIALRFFAGISSQLLFPRTGFRAISSLLVAPYTSAFVGYKSFLAATTRHQSSASSTTRAFSKQIDFSNFTSSEGSGWEDVLPLHKGSHNSVRVKIPADPEDEQNDLYVKSSFPERLNATVTACRELGKSSLWIEVPMSRASLIEDMSEFGLRFHHAEGSSAVLNLWLLETDSKVPTFSTHNVGVGGVVVNSREEILCVRELRTNYLKWKTPTGHSELGEHIDEAIEREVLEETGIRAKFHSILSFRQTHGLAHGRSDLFFVCRLDPIEETDEDGNAVIKDPVAQECEIAEAAWVPLSEYKSMIYDSENGHPMMRHVIDVFESGRRLEKRVVNSVVPGREPNAIYYPA